MTNQNWNTEPSNQGNQISGSAPYENSGFEYTNPINQPQMPDHQPEMPGQYNQMPGQYNQMPGQHDQMPGQHDQMPGQYNQMPGQYNQMPGQYNQMPGQYDQMPGQYNQSSQPQNMHSIPRNPNIFASVFSLNFGELPYRAMASIVYLLSIVGLGLYYILAIVKGITNTGSTLDRLINLIIKESKNHPTYDFISMTKLDNIASPALWDYLWPILAYPILFIAILGALKIALSAAVKYLENRNED